MWTDSTPVCQLMVHPVIILESTCWVRQHNCYPCHQVRLEHSAALPEGLLQLLPIKGRNTANYMSLQDCTETIKCLRLGSLHLNLTAKINSNHEVKERLQPQTGSFAHVLPTSARVCASHLSCWQCHASKHSGWLQW